MSKTLEHSCAQNNTITKDSTTIEAVSLFMTEGSSDKEYHVQLVKTNAGYLVNMQNGRRGGTLVERTKTPKPIELELAKKTFNTIVLSKKKDGYTEDETGKLFSTSEQQFTGIVPQLLNPIPIEQAQLFIDDASWVAQEKHDGHRRQMKADLTAELNYNVQSINRKGISCGMPQETSNALLLLKEFAPYIIDGELIGAHYYIFDVTVINGADLRSKPLAERLVFLQKINDVIVKSQQNASALNFLHVSQSAYSKEQKQALFDSLLANHREGIVFKKLSAVHNCGRPASGGNALKCKFLKTATVRVKSQQKNKRSVNIEILNEQSQWIDLGKVTIPANAQIPEPQELIEVRYLYAYPNGALAQPNYIMTRDDLCDIDCKISQLVYKSEEQHDEDDSE